MTQYILQIKADTNDADYVTQSTKVSMEQIERLFPVIEAIKNCKEHYNWPNSEYRDGSPQDTYSDIDPDLIDEFSDYCPYGEYGIHTIKSVIYFPATQETKLL